MASVQRKVLRVRDLSCPSQAGVEEWQWARVLDQIGDEVVAKARHGFDGEIVMTIMDDVFERITAILEGGSDWRAQDPDWWKDA